MTEQRPMTRAEKVHAAVWLDQLAETATAHAKRIRNELQTEAHVEYIAQGVRPSWTVPDVATVAGKVSKPAYVVSDPAALVEWLIERHPDEVVPTPRDSFVRRLLQTVVRDGDLVIDRNGEPVPGITYKPGGDWLGVALTATPEAKEVFGALAAESPQVAALTAGPVVAGDLLAIATAETPGHLDPGEVDA